MRGEGAVERVKVRVIRVLDIVSRIYILTYFSNFNLYGLGLG